MAVHVTYVLVQSTATGRARGHITSRDNANALRVVVTNKGYNPVKIGFLGLKAPAGYKLVSIGSPTDQPDGQPWWLEPLGIADCFVELEPLRKLGIPYGFCLVAVDVRGQHYWSKVGPVDFLRRWWFLRFGKPGVALRISQEEPPVVEIPSHWARY